MSKLDEQDTVAEECLLPDHDISWVGDVYACLKCQEQFVLKSLIKEARIDEIERLDRQEKKYGYEKWFKDPKEERLKQLRKELNE